MAIAVAIGLFAVNVVRAAKQGFTIDEAFSFNRFIHPPLLETWGSYDANHHVLLCLLSRGLLVFLAPSELVLRLPVVLGGGLYLAASLVVCRALSTRAWFLIAYLALVLNPFVLDYLSIARGYGLGLGLYMTAVAIIVRANNLPNWTVACGLLMGLSIASNLVFVVPVTALLIAVVAVGNQFKWAVQTGLFATGMAGALLYAPMISAGWDRFYFGSETFYKMAESLYKASLLHHPWIWEQLAYSTMDVGMAAGFVLVLSSCVAGLWPSGDGEWTSQVIVLTLLFSLGLLVFMHVAFHVQYPYGRTGLYLPPLATLAVIAGAQRFRPALKGVVAGVLILVTGCFVLEWNTRIYGDFAFDSGTKKTVEAIWKSVAERGNRGRAEVSVGSSWMYAETINFYREIYHLEWMKAVERGNLSENHNYYLLLPDDAGLVEQRHLKVISINQRTKQILAEDQR